MTSEHDTTPSAALEAASVTAGPTGCSASIASLTAALAKAQGAIRGASKDRTADVVAKSGAKFKYDYATLAAIWDACREPLSVNQLAVLQLTSAEGPHVTVATILAHSSGEWVCSELSMESETRSPQAIGSCITYARKYALAAMVGVAPEDDDGNEASVSHIRPPAGDVEGLGRPIGVLRGVYKDSDPLPGPSFEAPAELSGVKAHWTKLEAAADLGTEHFDKVWEKLAPEVKTFIMADKERRDRRRLLAERAALVMTKGGKP